MASPYIDALMSQLAAMLSATYSDGTSPRYQLNGPDVTRLVDKIKAADITGTAKDPVKGLADTLQADHDKQQGLDRGRYPELVTKYNELLNDPNKLMKRYYDPVNTGFSTLASEQDAASSALLQGYGDRQTNLLDYLTGLGDRARADIDQRAVADKAGNLASMQQRGLANTTVLDSANQGVNTSRDQEIARLNEQLRREAMGVFGDASLQGLQSQERARDANVALGTEQLGFRERRADVARGISTAPLEFRANQQFNYPSLVDVANISLQASKAANERSNVPTRSLFG